MKFKREKIAVLIPCYNEEITIAKVVSDFKTILPSADVYVYDNNSKDLSVKKALDAGAIIKHEYLQGKGNVVRTMFNEIDADIYIMVDGDDTYPAEEVLKLIEPVKNGKADMVIGDRLSSTYYTENKRPFHNFGNSLVKNLLNSIFKAKITDVMTGYRAFSKRFVKTMPVTSTGFEIETEMTIFALNQHMRIMSVPISYRDRPEGSFSKLNTFKDGFRVLKLLSETALQYKPLFTYSFLALLALAVKMVLKVGDYLPTGLFVAGLILEGMRRGNNQLLEAATHESREP